MKYNGQIIPRQHYDIKTALLDLKRTIEEYSREEKRQMKKYQKMQQVDISYRQTLNPPPPKCPLFENIYTFSVYQHFFFPNYELILSSEYDLSMLIPAVFGKDLSLYFTINDTSEKAVFEFALGQKKEVFCWYRREKNSVTVSEFHKEFFELLGIPDESNIQYLFNLNLSCVEVADHFSSQLGIPLLFGEQDEDVLPISEMIREDEERSKYAGKLDWQRPVFGIVDNYKTGTTLSDYRPLIQSKYISAYEPLRSTLKKFPFEIEISKLDVDCFQWIKRCDHYSKTTCLHLFRKDLSKDALNKIVDWCEFHSQNYSILIENLFIGIWCSEWHSEPAERCYYHLSQSFNCRVVGFWMHDDLFFSLSLMKDRKVIAEASFGEEGASISNQILAQQEFDIELPLLKNYDDVDALLEKMDCFTIQPENNSLAERFQEYPHGIVYNLSTNI